MNRLRSWYANRWARYALTAVLLVLVALKVQPQHLLSATTSVRPEYLAAALLLTIPFLYLKALRWHLMLRAGGVDASFGEAALSLLGGMGVALITPARLGELVRAFYLRDPQKLRIGGLVMIDKGFDVLVLCGLSIFGAFALLGPPVGTAFALITLVGLAAVYRPAELSHVLHGVSGRLPLATRFQQVVGSLETLTPRTTTIYLGLTLLSFVAVLLQFGVVLLNWHAWSPNIVFLTFPLIVLTNVLPITIGGLGVREGVAALLLRHYGVPAADAAVAAFLMFAMNTALPGVVGALLIPAAPQAQPSRTVRSLDRP